MLPAYLPSYHLPPTLPPRHLATYPSHHPPITAQEPSHPPSVRTPLASCSALMAVASELRRNGIRRPSSPAFLHPPLFPSFLPLAAEGVCWCRCRYAVLGCWGVMGGIGGCNAGSCCWFVLDGWGGGVGGGWCGVVWFLAVMRWCIVDGMPSIGVFW
jgi:hypothetical protein